MFQVREELQRHVHRREAAAAIAQEHERRITNPAAGFHPVDVDQALKNVQEELVRRFAVRVAIALMQAERQQRVASNQFSHVVDELASKAARRTAAQVEAEEQARRLATPQSPVPSGDVDRMHAVHEALVRTVHRTDILKQMEAERQRRLVEVQHAAVMEELVRHTAIIEVDAAMMVEQAQRVQADRMQAVLERLVQVVNAKHADQDMEDERRQRIVQDLRLQAHEELHRYLAKRLVNGLIAQAQAEANVRTLPEPSEAHTQLCEAVVHAANGRMVTAACQLEQAQRIAQEAMQAVVLPTLLSLLNRRAVKMLTAVEQAQRIAQQEMQAHVLPELQRRASQIIVHACMEEERQARMAKDASSSVLMDLLRKVNAHHADIDMAREQADRIAQDQHEIRLSDVHRQLHAKFADVDIRQEHAYRLAHPLDEETPVQNALVAELQRHFDVEAVTKAEVEEQQMRSAQRWLTVEVLPELERRQQGRKVDAEMMVEQAQRVQADRMQAVLERLVRVVKAKHADQDMEEERLQRIAQDTFATVMAQLVRLANQERVDQACEVEREERVQQARFANVAEELFRHHARKAASQAVDEFRMEMGLNGSFQAASVAMLEVSEANQELHDELLSLVAERLQVRSVHAAAMVELQQQVLRNTMQRTYNPVLAQLASQANRQQTRAQEIQEQTRRVQVETQNDVTESIRRALAWKQADDAMDREQRARVELNVRLDRDAVLERTTNAAHADVDMDAEQKSRVELGDVLIGLRNDDRHVMFREAIMAEVHRRQSLAEEQTERAWRLSQQNYDTVMAQLESQSRRQAAQAVAAHEQAQALHARLLDGVLHTLVARVHRSEVARACQHELAMATQKRVMDRVVTQLHEQSSRKQAVQWEESERCRRLSEPLPEASLALLQVQEEAASKARRKQLDELEAMERAERVHHDKLDPVMTQLTRRASLATVKTLMAAEQAERMQRVEYQRAMDQLLAVQHRKAAAHAVRLEQQLQTHHPRVADANVAQNLSTLQEQMLHAVNGKQALRMEVEEQERRRFEQQRSYMFDELYRAVNHHDERVVSKDARHEWLGLLKTSSPDIKRRHSDVMTEMQLQVATQE